MSLCEGGNDREANALTCRFLTNNAKIMRGIFAESRF